RYEDNGKAVLSRIVTGDVTWVFDYTPESNAESMTWKHRRSPAKKKFKIVQSTAKVTAALSWDVYVVLWVVCIPVGSITTAAAYQEILKNVEETNRQRTPGCCPKEVFCTTMPDQRVMPQLQTS
ncbi:hypothetical protein Cfor_08522, partial [Coptotermes formosanus]